MQFLIVTTDFNAVFLLDILVKREKEEEEEEEEHLEDIVVVVVVVIISVSPPLERGALCRSAARPYQAACDQTKTAPAMPNVTGKRARLYGRKAMLINGSRRKRDWKQVRIIRFARRRSRGRGRCHQPETPREYKPKHQNEHSRPKKGSNVCVCV